MNAIFVTELINSLQEEERKKVEDYILERTNGNEEDKIFDLDL